MPADGAANEDLKANIALTRKRPLNFGVCLAGKPEDTQLLFDRRKAPEVLARAARKLGSGKATFGTASSEGRVLSLRVDGSILPGMAKKMKMFLRKSQVKVSVVILDVDGNIVEQELEEEELEGGAESFEADDPNAAKWAIVEEKMTPQVARAASTDTYGDPGALRAAWALAVEKGRNGEFEEALRLAARLANMLASAGVGSDGERAVDPDREEYEVLSKYLKPKLVAALKAGTGNVTQLKGGWGMAMEKAEAGEFADAVKILKVLGRRLDEAAAAAPEDGPAEGSVAAQAAANEYLNKLKALMPDIKTSFTVQPGREADARALIKAVTDAIEARAADTAGEAFAAVEAFVAQARLHFPAKETYDAQAQALKDRTKALADRIEALPALSDQIAALGAYVEASDTAAAEENWVAAVADFGPWGTALAGVTATIREGAARKKALRDQLPALTVVEGASEDQTAPLRALSAEIEGLLNAALPTDEAFSEADRKLTELAAARQGVIQLVAKRKAVEAAYAAAKDSLEKTAGLDTELYKTAGSYRQLKDLIQSAKALLQGAQGVMGRDNPVHWGMITVSLRDWTENQNPRVQPAIDTCKDEIKQALIVSYGPKKEKFEELAATDLDYFSGQPDEGAIKAAVQEFKDAVAAINAAIASDDTAKHLAAQSLYEETRAKIAAANDLIQVATARMYKEYLGSMGASQAHQDGLMTLLNTSDAAHDTVVDILSSTAAILGNAEATPAFIAERKKASDEAGKLWSELGDTIEALKSQLDDRNAEWHAANDLVQAKKQEIEDDPFEATEDIAEDPRIAELANLRAERGQIDAAAVALEGQIAARTAEQEAASRTYFDELKRHRAADKQRKVLNAISFGPLSAVTGNPVPAEQVEKITALYKDNPDIAEKACGLMANATDTAALTDCAVAMAARTKNRFAYTEPGAETPTKMDPDLAEALAMKTLEMTAFLGKPYADEANAAFDRGAQFLPDTAVSGGISFKAAGDARAKLLARGVFDMPFADTPLDPDADAPPPNPMTIDLDADAFATALDELQFSQDALVNNTPMVTENVRKLKAFLETDDNLAKAQAIIDSVTEVPASDDAKKLVAKSLGISEDEVDVNSVKIAIMKSMMTPVAQGAVGSCFATAPVLNLREQDPLAVMEMYRDLATKGEITPKAGEKVPAITKLPADEDPLVRSLEYTVAAAAARLENSRERTRATDALFDDSDTSVANLAQLSTKLDSTAWAKLEPKLTAEIAKSMSYVYDPTAEASETSSDGSSDKGFYRMIDKATKEEITTKDKFKAFIKKYALAAADAAGLEADEKAIVDAHVSTDDVADAVAAAMGKYPPWDMAFGGFGDQATDVLIGGDGSARSTSLVDTDSGDSEGDRALKLLAAIATQLGGSEKTVIATSGMHSFNAMPETPEMAALRSGSLSDNLDNMLLGPGAAIASTKIPKDRAAYLYRKELTALLETGYEDDEKEELRKAMDDVPASDVTPAELEAHTMLKLKTFREAIAKRLTDAWKAKQTGAIDPTALAKKEAEHLAAADADVKNCSGDMLIHELGAPEFVVADTNWGSERDHQLFVIAPDPRTGEPKLWEKSVMTGKLTPKSEDWLKANWRLEELPPATP